MSIQTLSRLSINCPICGAHNSITASEVSEDVQVGCSKCRALIGPWGDVKRKSESQERGERLTWA